MKKEEQFAGISGIQPQKLQTEFDRKSATKDFDDTNDKSGMESRYPKISLPGASLLSRLNYRQVLLILAASTAMNFGLDYHYGKDRKAYPPGADLQQITEQSLFKHSHILQRYQQGDDFIERLEMPEFSSRYDIGETYVYPNELRKFCRDVQREIKTKYIGKSKIVDFECNLDKLVMTMDDGTVVTAIPRVGVSLTGPGASYNTSLTEVVNEAVRRHSEADDYYVETGFSMQFFFNGAQKDEMCRKIVDDVNARFAERITNYHCAPDRIEFTSASGETVTATPNRGIEVKTNRPPPRRPGS
ncbi:MAG: hypothetical protein EA357_02255 [Micavibrio sp.]|nr:MAG: hypothetical protein EA357_02255 [Micavibrio sp.]